MTMESSAGREIMSRVDWRARQLCKYCDDLQHTGSDENTMVLCDCCVATGAHVKCLAKHEGKVITPEQINSPAFIWFCGSVCSQIHGSLVDRTGSGISPDAAGTFTAELVCYSVIDRQSQRTIRAAEEMFKSAFVATPCADGRDMIEIVCRGEAGQADASALPVKVEDGTGEEDDSDSEEPVPDCTNFRVFVLKKGGTVVSAAAIRVHGDLFVEVPYVATREGYRRQGNCHRLMTALESFLSEIGVRWILLQAGKASVPIWTKRFGFMKATGRVASEVQDRVVFLNETKVLLKMIEKKEAMSMPREFGNREVGKSRKRQRIRFGHPIATILGDDGQNEMDKIFVDDTFKLREVVTEVPSFESTNLANRNHDDPYPSKNTAMDVLDSEKVAECADQVQNSIQLHGAEPEVQGDKALGTKSQGVNWVHEQSGTSPTSTVYDEEDEDEDQDQDQGGGINNAEEDLAAITVHLEDFVANQLQAVSILQDAMDMNESLLHSTIMNAAMDARIATTDTYSFGFLPADNKKRCLLSPRSLTALMGATEDAVRYAQATVDRFQQQLSVQTT